MRVEAFISNHKTFTIECPTCRYSEERRLADLPSGHPNPVHCECPCGARLTVHLVGFRGSPRKSVRLAASLVRRVDGRRLRRFATVLDLSARGMRVVTEYVKNLHVDDELTVSLVLDDGKRTKLDVPATVRRIVPEKGHFTVGVEFRMIDPHDLAILKGYLSS